MVVVELACWPRSFLCLSPAAMLILLLLLWGGNAWRNKTWKVMKLCEAGPPLLLWQCFAWRENALGSRSSEGEKEAEEETVASCSSTRFSATKMRPSSRLPSGERERERGSSLLIYCFPTTTLRSSSSCGRCGLRTGMLGRSTFSKTM